MSEEEFDNILASHGFSDEKRHLLFMSVVYSSMRKILIDKGICTQEELDQMANTERKNIIEQMLPKYKSIKSPFLNQ